MCIPSEFRRVGTSASSKSSCRVPRRSSAGALSLTPWSGSPSQRARVHSQYSKERTEITKNNRETKKQQSLLDFQNNKLSLQQLNPWIQQIHTQWNRNEREGRRVKKKKWYKSKLRERSREVALDRDGGRERTKATELRWLHPHKQIKIDQVSFHIIDYICFLLGLSLSLSR